jgi:hypothetical protein
VGAEFFHADRQTDRQTNEQKDMIKLIFVFLNFAKASKIFKNLRLEHIALFDANISFLSLSLVTHCCQITLQSLAIPINTSVYRHDRTRTLLSWLLWKTTTRNYVSVCRHVLMLVMITQQNLSSAWWPTCTSAGLDSLHAWILNRTETRFEYNPQRRN